MLDVGGEGKDSNTSPDVLRHIDPDKGLIFIRHCGDGQSWWLNRGGRNICGRQIGGRLVASMWIYTKVVICNGQQHTVFRKTEAVLDGGNNKLAMHTSPGNQEWNSEGLVVEGDAEASPCFCRFP